MSEDLKIIGLFNEVYLTIDLMNWADWLNDFCMLIVMEYCLVWQTIYSVTLRFKCWRITAVVLNQGFYEKYPLGTNGPKIGFFLYFEKIWHWFLLKTHLNKNCSEFDVIGCDLGCSTRFWISTTELIVIMNSFPITEKNKNQRI